jgi:hypothetical protein
MRQFRTNHDSLQPLSNPSLSVLALFDLPSQRHHFFLVPTRLLLCSLATEDGTLQSGIGSLALEFAALDGSKGIELVDLITDGAIPRVAGSAG